MNVSYVNPFISSTIETFKTMMATDVTPGKPFLKSEPFPPHDISGIIGLSGDAQGCIAITFPKISALKIVSAFMGMEVKIVGPDLTDAIGELANIIAGNAKKDLNGFNLSISLPNVVVGKDHVIVSQRNIPTLIVPFSCQYGEFNMEVSLRT